MSSGRPKGEEADKLEKLFEINIDQFVQDGKVLPPKNCLWSVLRAQCQDKKTEKAVYAAALKWFNKRNVFKEIGSENEYDNNESSVKDISIETSLEKSTDTTFDKSTDTTFDTSNTSNDSGSKKNSKKFAIKILPKIWRTIAPKETLLKRKREGSHNTGVRKYVYLEPGLWTNVVANEIEYLL